MSEQQLKVIGIPLGPRTRILQEMRRLRPHPDAKQPNPQAKVDAEPLKIRTYVV